MEVREYWFETFRRVLVVKLSYETFISIDVYKDSWNYNIDSELEIDNVKLIYHNIDPAVLGLDPRQDLVELVGVNVGSKREVVNVRVRIKSRDVDDDFIKKLYINVVKLVENREVGPDVKVESQIIG